MCDGFHPSPHEIAPVRDAHRLSDDKAESHHLGVRIRANVRHRVRVCCTNTPTYRRLVVGPPRDAIGFGEHRAGLGGELGAALAATGGQDGTAGTGAHPQTEAVGLGTLAVVRLERSLAHINLRVVS